MHDEVCKFCGGTKETQRYDDEFKETVIEPCWACSTSGLKAFKGDKSKFINQITAAIENAMRPKSAIDKLADKLELDLARTKKWAREILRKDRST